MGKPRGPFPGAGPHVRPGAPLSGRPRLGRQAVPPVPAPSTRSRPTFRGRLLGGCGGGLSGRGLRLGVLLVRERRGARRLLHLGLRRAGDHFHLLSWLLGLDRRLTFANDLRLLRSLLLHGFDRLGLLHRDRLGQALVINGVPGSLQEVRRFLVILSVGDLRGCLLRRGAERHQHATTVRHIRRERGGAVFVLLDEPLVELAMHLALLQEAGSEGHVLVGRAEDDLLV
mmetsp:Transcript_83474/g.241150  ORF Transcript_83474/g.241150 Transcript_83474/m.241150 type:complete len:228 (+) Transcript_83474:99-782(+)